MRLTARSCASLWREEAFVRLEFGRILGGRPLRRAATTAFLLMLAAGLTGCAGWYPSEKGYRQILDTWIGATGEQLVAKWGLPDAEHTSPTGTKIYQYRSQRSYTVRGGTKQEQVKVDGNYVWVDVPQPDQTETTWCDTTFHLNGNDVIESYYFKGPDCTAHEK